MCLPSSLFDPISFYFFTLQTIFFLMQKYRNNLLCECFCTKKKSYILILFAHILVHTLKSKTNKKEADENANDASAISEVVVIKLFLQMRNTARKCTQRQSAH